MREIEIRVSREDIETEAAKNTSYAGAKRVESDPEANAGAYDRFLMTDADQETLGRFWEEICMEADSFLSEWLKERTQSDEEYICRAYTARDYNAALDGSVKASVRRYFIERMTGLWYSLFPEKEEAKMHIELAEAEQNRVKELLSSRRFPRRPAGYTKQS